MNNVAQKTEIGNQTDPKNGHDQDFENSNGVKNESNTEMSKSGRELAYSEKDLPNLHEAKESAIDLSSEYWSPETPGEYKVGVPVAIEDKIYEDRDTGEQVLLPSVIFIEQTKDGQLRAVRNGSKRLVATIENSVKTGDIVFGKSFIKIVFNGKQKNTTNQYMSDRWSVKPLIVNL